MQTNDHSDEATDMPEEENVYQVLQGCIFDLLRGRKSMLDEPDLLAYIDHKIAVLRQIDHKIAVLRQAQQDLIAYARLQDALRAALGRS